MDSSNNSPRSLLNSGYLGPILLPIALICLCTSPGSPIGLSSFEFLYGRSFLFNQCLQAQSPLLLGYLPYLSPTWSLLHSQTDSCLLAPMPMHPTVPEPTPVSLGDWVLLKQLAPESLAVVDRTLHYDPHHPFSCQALGHQYWYHQDQVSIYLSRTNGLSSDWGPPPSSFPECSKEGPRWTSLSNCVSYSFTFVSFALRMFMPLL